VPIVCPCGGERGYAAADAGTPVLVEERRGSQKDRLARVAGRGREESAPVALHFGVMAAVGALVALILIVAMVLWAVLR
jgi:hypothetical protein